MSLLSLRCLAAHTTSFPLGSAARQVSAALAPSRPRCSVPQRRPSSVSVRAMSSGSDADLVAMINGKNAENKVMVYSKTYCPYCTEVKGLFEKMGVSAKVVELDELADGGAVQDALGTVTGRRTVPQVFVGGQHVGGCDDTIAAMSSGKLKELLESAGVQAKL